jgi:hypothetical protein
MSWMPNARVTLPDGTKINVQGSEEEIARILRRITVENIESDRATKPKETSSKSQSAASGPTGHIRGLADEGFFKQKRSIGDIQKRLETKGHIYATTNLSPILVRLTRSRVLRRLREDGAWYYVEP